MVPLHHVKFDTRGHESPRALWQDSISSDSEPVPTYYNLHTYLKAASSIQHLVVVLAEAIHGGRLHGRPLPTHYSLGTESNLPALSV